MIYDDPRLDEFKKHLNGTGSVDAAWEKVFGPYQGKRSSRLLDDLEATQRETERLTDYQRGKRPVRFVGHCYYCDNHNVCVANNYCQQQAEAGRAKS